MYLTAGSTEAHETNASAYSHWHDGNLQIGLPRPMLPRMPRCKVNASCQFEWALGKRPLLKRLEVHHDSSTSRETDFC
jgi:hypothetical protein